MTTLANLTIEHLGDLAGDADLTAFRAAVENYMDAEDVEDEEAAIDALWGDGNFWPNVERWAPDEAAAAIAQR